MTRLNDKKSSTTERLIEQDLTLVLVSDAGTPCISDPGYHLVAEAHKRGVAVHPIPGPSAVTSLVSASGLLCNKFDCRVSTNKKVCLRKRNFQLGKNWNASGLLRNSRRLEKSFKIIESFYPEVTVCVGRELTKMHEEIKTMSIVASPAPVSRRAKGWSCCDGWSFYKKTTPSTNRQYESSQIHVPQRESLRDLVAQFKDCGLSRSDLYKLLLNVKGELDE